MGKVDEERNYWDSAATDPEVDIKYICDMPTDKCLQAIGELEGNVLEIGCGVGRLLKPGYWGIDISQNMLDIAKKRIKTATLLLNDGRTIPLPDESIDSVYCMLVFQHLKPKAVKGYIKEVGRVLARNGKFRFQFVYGTERNPYSNKYTFKEFTDWLNEAGLTVTAYDKHLVHEEWNWITACKLST